MTYQGTQLPVGNGTPLICAFSIPSGVKLTANDWKRVTSWSPYETARRYRNNYQPSKNWDKVSDAELEAAAADARAALGV